MVKNYPGEEWKTVKFNFEYTNDGSIEISNFGRLRTFNKLSAGNIINGSMINGYRIVRLKFYKPREGQEQEKFDKQQQQLYRLARKIKAQKENGESKQVIKEATERLETMKKNLSKKFQADLKDRTIHYHSLIHRLVATYFLKKPGAKQTVVGHIDHNKLNNKASNLKWMTPAENYEHQQHSPHVIKEKKLRKDRHNLNSKSTKLTVEKVMQIKKLLKQDIPLRHLARKFGVTDTQIIRIKRGENWSNVKAAK